MLYNYEIGMKQPEQGESSIYTFSLLTTYKINTIITFFSVSIKEVSKFKM